LKNDGQECPSSSDHYEYRIFLMSFRRYILASRSPRRLELLRQIVHPELIDVRPPPSAAEADFGDCFDVAAIHQRLGEIARHKSEQVRQALNAEEASLHELPRTLLISADTAVVVTDRDGRPLVLGQPPDDDEWREVVADWFRHYYAGRTHTALTAVHVVTPDGRHSDRLIETRVTFRPDIERWLNWYLLTGEPLGKAGGYALQGAGSVFIERVEGSLSNVVGLPLEALLELFADTRLN
jgi:septum formation protein